MDEIVIQFPRLSSNKTPLSGVMRVHCLFVLHSQVSQSGNNAQPELALVHIVCR